MRLVHNFPSVGRRALGQIRYFFVVEMRAVYDWLDLICQERLAGVQAEAVVADDIGTLHHTSGNRLRLSAVCQARSFREALEANAAISTFIFVFSKAF